MRIKDVSVAALGMVILLVATVAGFTGKKGEEVCIGIYYDPQVSDSSLKALSIAEELKKFVEETKAITTLLIPVSSYQAGGLDRCGINFYVGQAQDRPLPREFLGDFLATSSKVVWMGPNIGQLGESLESQLGVRLLGIADDPEASVSGEVFYRGRSYRRTSGDPGIELLARNHPQLEVLAEWRPQGTKEVLPYAVRSLNRYYIADSFLPDVQAAILADILWNLK